MLIRDCAVRLGMGLLASVRIVVCVWGSGGQVLLWWNGVVRVKYVVTSICPAVNDLRQ